MLRKSTLRLPINLYEDLHDEALKYRVSMSDVIRSKLLELKYPIRNEIPQHELAQQKAEHSCLSEEITKQISEIHFATLEILFLLREFLFERNAQILKRVDAPHEFKNTGLGASHLEYWPLTAQKDDYRESG
jgi:hypothetical protein